MWSCYNRLLSQSVAGLSKNRIKQCQENILLRATLNNSRLAFGLYLVPPAEPIFSILAVVFFSVLKQLIAGFLIFI